MKMDIATCCRMGLSTVLLLAAAATLSAAELQLDRSISNEDRTIADDYVFAGESLGFSGSSDSLFFLGRSLSVTGEASRALFAMGATIDVSGTVGDDALMAGRDVNLTGTLGSTAFAAGRNVTLHQEGIVDGDVFAAARRITLAGVVNGDVYSGSRTLIISGTVNGDITAVAGDIVIEEGAVINGDFSYRSENRLSEAEQERIQGSISFNQPGYHQRWRGFDRFMRLGKWFFTIILMLSALVFSLLFYLFPGIRKGFDDQRGQRRFWLTAAWGLIPFVAYPAAIGALFTAGFLFGITIPLAVTLLLSIGGVGFVLTALALPQIGGYISRLLSLRLHSSEKPYILVKTLLGFAAMFILGLIPIVSGLVFVVVLSLGWGVAIEKLFAVELARESENQAG